MDAPDLKPPPAKALLNIGRGSGAPAGYADFVPLNPWGRDFPKDLRERKPRPPLYQVVVRDRKKGNKELRVGPKWAKECAELLQLEIARMIASGAERQWSDPIVLLVPAELT